MVVLLPHRRHQPPEAGEVHAINVSWKQAEAEHPRETLFFLEQRAREPARVRRVWRESRESRESKRREARAREKTRERDDEERERMMDETVFANTPVLVPSQHLLVQFLCVL